MSVVYTPSDAIVNPPNAWRITMLGRLDEIR